MTTAMERLQIVLDEANRHSGYSIPYFQLRDLAKSFAQELDGRGVGVPNKDRLEELAHSLGVIVRRAPTSQMDPGVMGVWIGLMEMLAAFQKSE